jgi:hypothetical protein
MSTACMFKKAPNMVIRAGDSILLMLSVTILYASIVGLTGYSTDYCDWAAGRPPFTRVCVHPVKVSSLLSNRCFINAAQSRSPFTNRRHRMRPSHRSTCLVTSLTTYTSYLPLCGRRHSLSDRRFLVPSFYHP